MKHFTQKWCLVSLLEPAQEGTVFKWKDWYLHVTFAGVFSIDMQNSNLIEKLSVMLADQKPIVTTTKEDVNFGPSEKPLPVTLLKNTNDLQRLHDKIVELLTDNGAVFNEQKYIGEEYTPHATMQINTRVGVGDIVTLNNLAIIDMYVDNDGYMRKIYKILHFGT